MIKRSLLTRIGAVALAAAMILGTGCGNKTNGTTTVTPTAAPTAAPTAGPAATPTPTPVPWDGAYIEKEDYQAYIAYDLQDVANSMMSQLTASQKTAVEKIVADGTAAIENGNTIAEVKAAYNEAYTALLAAVPKAEGLESLMKLTKAEKTEILGSLEKYAVSLGLTGLSLFEDGGYVMYNPRITLGTENYIVGYGFGTLAEGAITADLEYETNAAWKRYYHTYEAEDPGTLNYYNDQGSVVGGLFGYSAAGLFTTFMNATKDGYDWVPELAMEQPTPVNDTDGDGVASKWRVQIRTGNEGLKYTTGSKIESRAAFNNRPVAAEDYLTPYKLLLTQANGLYRGSEMAKSKSGAIVGAAEFYDGTKEGFNQELWNNVGIRVYEENGKTYLEWEFTNEYDLYYTRYYISSSLTTPLPQDFIDLVTVKNLCGYNLDATETPADNTLSLGAFYVEDYTSGQQIVFKKNPNYVYADTKYSIGGVHIKIFTAAAQDTEAGFNEFLAGHFDSTGIPKEHLNEYRNDPRTRTTTGSSVFKLNMNACDAATWEYLFGTDGVVTQTAKEDYWEVKPVLSNGHFTKALSYSIDRKSFASARGSIPSVDYLSSNYMSDPENGISYSATAAHKNAVASLLEGTDGAGYSLELARDYFRVAISELEAEGYYTAGTKENPTKITLEFAWMYTTHEDNYHNEIKQFIETAFNDESVTGGKYQLECVFWVGNAWSDVYYNKMMVGQFDIGFGSISGNSLDPLGFVSVLSSDQKISGSFTLNWGKDTNDTDVYPLVYNGKRYSFDGLYNAANSQAILVEGKNKDILTINYNEIQKNADGSYTASMEIEAALPDITTVTVTDVVCCNYERYYYGDNQYDDKSVTFDVKESTKGKYVITMTVDAATAADYITGSGTSEKASGYTGFDVYYTLDFNGNSSDTYESVKDSFIK